MAILELDVSNKRAYKYVQIYRQNETGVNITVRLYENGKSQFAGMQDLKLSLFFPFNNYEIPASNSDAATQTYQFAIPTDVLKNNVGDAERAYVHYTTAQGNVRSTGDFIFKIVSQGDISAGQGSTYIGRLEELIKQFNNRFDAYMKTIQDNTASIQYKVDQLKVQADKIDAELNKLNLPLWENQITKMVDGKIAKMQQMIDKFNSDNAGLKNKVTALESKNAALESKVTTLEKELNKPMKFYGIYSGGAKLQNIKEHTLLNVGDLIASGAAIYGRNINPSPITKASSTTYNVTRACKVRVILDATLQCGGINKTGKYVYLTSFSSNTLDSAHQRVSGRGIGSSGGVEYKNDVILDFVTDLKPGEVMNFAPELAAGKTLDYAWINTLTIQEL